MDIKQRDGMEKKQFNVFLPKLPDQQCGQLYGVIDTIVNDELKTGKRSCDYFNVYIKSFFETADLHLLGTFMCDLNQKQCHQQPLSSKFWIELESQQSIVSVSRLVYDSVEVPPKKILLCHDNTNISFKSSRCLSELCSGNRLTGQQATVNRLEIQHDSLWNISKVVEHMCIRHLQYTAWSQCNSKIEASNLLFTVLADLLLGISVIQLFGGTTHIIEFLLTSIKVIADFVENLIEWLMGVPIGLKLNKPLSTVLGKFFIYHLYLWKTYVDLIQPLITIVKSIAPIVSCAGGFTFLVALLNDIISVASLHCYCFYVYATRLYFYARYGLLSTLRLYSGRKRNPLRNRVDSGVFEWDQLCFGMLIFCVLLFLFPTILVFYIVFLLLRLGVLIVQGTLERLNWLMNAFPFVTLLFWIFDSDVLATSVRIEVVSHSSCAVDNKHSIVRIQRAKLPLVETLHLTANPALHPYPRIEWWELIKKMVAGQLIYPF